MCDELYIMISWCEGRESTSKELRYRWIYNSIKHLDNVKIIMIEDEAVSKEVYNTDFYYHVPIGRAMMQKFTGLDDPKQHPLHKYLNPMPYLNGKMNNALVVKGLIDVMTLTQSTGMVKTLKKAGVDYDFYHNRTFPNSFHDFMLLAPTKQAKKCMKYTANWLNAKAFDKEYERLP